MMGEKLFAVGLLVIALVAALYAAPKAVELSIGYGTHIGGPDDDSATGTSLLPEIISKLGYKVILEKEPGAARNYTSIVYFVANPTSCREEFVTALVNHVYSLASLGYRVAFIVSDEGLCAPYLASLLGAPQPVTYSVSPRDYLVFTEHGVIFALHTVMVVEAPTGWRVAGYTFPNSLPGLLVHQGLVTMVYVPDSDAFTNAVLKAENRTGLDPLAETRFILSLAGAEPGTTVVVIPLYLYEQEYTAQKLATQIHPGILVMQAMSYLSSGEQRLLGLLQATPGAMAVASLLAAAPMYLVLREAMGTGSAVPREEEEAPRSIAAYVPSLLIEAETLPRIGPSPGRLRSLAARLYRALDQGFREAYGRGLEEELVSPRVLSPWERRVVRRLRRLASSRLRALLVIAPRRTIEGLVEDLWPIMARIYGAQGGRQ
ncbi:hypothetical protein PYJP_01770 [Pyrofollis japonicus]|uniref:hypothetical protein n=1 Tax=Pyrofollis japonicus TaxID=3060460 RepID=UPI00295BCC8A|nr:hypothetical protein [Pyrofollis japonicus]BEP16825.1 hypothetical protein PYJP_01770 [Pyrofollis japonicus]